MRSGHDTDHGCQPYDAPHQPTLLSLRVSGTVAGVAGVDAAGVDAAGEAVAGEVVVKRNVSGTMYSIVPEASLTTRALPLTATTSNVLFSVVVLVCRAEDTLPRAANITSVPTRTLSLLRDISTSCAC